MVKCLQMPTDSLKRYKVDEVSLFVRNCVTVGGRALREQRTSGWDMGDIYSSRPKIGEVRKATCEDIL